MEWLKRNFVLLHIVMCCMIVILVLIAELLRYFGNPDWVLYGFYNLLVSKNWFLLIDVAVKSCIVIGGVSIFTGILTKIDTQYYWGLFSIALCYMGCFAAQKLDFVAATVVLGVSTILLLGAYLVGTIVHILNSSVYFRKQMPLYGFRFIRKNQGCAKSIQQTISLGDADFGASDLCEIILNKYGFGFKHKEMAIYNSHEGFSLFFDAVLSDISVALKSLKDGTAILAFAKECLEAVHNTFGEYAQVKERNMAILGFYAALLYSAADGLNRDMRRELFLYCCRGMDGFRDIRRWMIIVLVELWNFTDEEENKALRRLEFDPDCYFDHEGRICGKDAWIVVLWNHWIEKRRTKYPYINFTHTNERFKNFLLKNDFCYFFGA